MSRLMIRLVVLLPLGLVVLLVWGLLVSGLPVWQLIVFSTMGAVLLLRLSVLVTDYLICWSIRRGGRVKVNKNF
ncbi:hypothetical protein [Dictyobacter arantiisoli]|uniref:Uncharacterized protein n=1 Tax=Dictyobacter arantiisoli TaxID=2014874 RepID=A0A5A5TB03_9CHLR|nr:hypothetical protein [Dictyobacter arantiisoli]GCF08084.1 hypothetical protein KDI_16480 [Dictyobacter arantiisoli]